MAVKKEMRQVPLWPVKVSRIAVDTLILVWVRLVSKLAKGRERQELAEPVAINSASIG